MDYKLINLGLLIFNMLVTGGVFLFVRNDNRHTKARESQAQLELKIQKQLDKKSDRLTQIESKLALVPTKSDIIRIHSRLDDTGDSLRQMVLMMGEISGQIKQMNKEKT